MNAAELGQVAAGTGISGMGLSAALGGLGPGGWAALAAMNLLPAIIGSSQKAAQRAKEAMLRAAEIRESPWTGRGPSTQITTAQPNVWADLLGAGLNVAGQAQGIGKSMREAKTQDIWNQLLMEKLGDKSAFGEMPPELSPEEIKQLYNLR